MVKNQFRNNKFSINDDLNLRALNEESIFKEYLESIKVHIQTCHDGLESIKNLKNARIDNNVSDIDFYNLYNQFYKLFYGDDNCKFIMEFAKKFLGSKTKKVTIKTDIPIEWREEEGCGRDFSYWIERGFRTFEVIFKEDYSYAWNKTYTKDELLELIKSRTMLIIKPKGVYKRINKETYKQYKISNSDYALLVPHYFGVCIEANQMDSQTLQKFLEYYPNFFELIRKSLSDKQINKDVENLEAYIEKTIQHVVSICNFQKGEHQRDMSILFTHKT